MRTLLVASTFAIGLAISSLAGATTVWDETVNGDLSSSATSPSALTIGVGSNVILGRMGTLATGGVDPDFFRFTIAPGTRLTAINVTAYSPDESAGGGSFFAIASGTSISTNNPGLHLSNTLLSDVGDILPQLSSNPVYGGTGLPANPGPGTYTAWFQETLTSVGYGFDLVVTPIPEPTTIATLIAGGTLMLRRRSA